LEPPREGQAPGGGPRAAAALYLSRAARRRVRVRPAGRRYCGEPLLVMMRLPPFRYLAPVSVADAAKLMADHGPAAMLVAGGTDLFPNMKRRPFGPSVLGGVGGGAS